MFDRQRKYRHHKPSGQAFVQLNGRRIYLGKYGSPESRVKFARVLAEFYATRQMPLAPGRRVTVAELLAAFWDFVDRRYVKYGLPTSEPRSFRVALGPVVELYGDVQVDAFGPLALDACRRKLVDAKICRTRINKHIGRIRRAFKWGVSKELVPESTWSALRSVEGLRRGEAPERPPVLPVPEAHIAAVEPWVTPQIWAMIQFQLLTACRPGEACIIRSADLETSGRIWLYRPHAHKLEHHALPRTIFVGPKAQAIIKPWLRSELGAYLFVPAEARRWYFEQLRKRSVNPPHKPRPRKSNPQRTPGACYLVGPYGNAIQRACKKASVPTWKPGRLRHNAATRIRKEFGIEAARIILGHQSAVTSEIYAERDLSVAQEIMLKLG